MKKTRKIALLFCVGYVLVNALTPYVGWLKERSVQNQIEHLNRAFEQGYDDQLQERYPEGKLFSNAIFALSVIEYGESVPLPAEYAVIVDSCVSRVLSAQALAPFNPDLIPKYGMFYNGWVNYVLTQYMASPLFRYSVLKERIIEQSQVIERRLVAAQEGGAYMLDSYSYMSWPADNCIGLLSLGADSLAIAWRDTIFFPGATPFWSHSP